MGNKPSATIRYQLSCLIIVSMLPVLLVSGILVFHAYSAKRDHVNTTMLNTARSLTMVVDRELMSVRAGLMALAASPSFATGDFASVHRQALQLLNSYPEAAIIVADVNGQQLVNSYLPYGTPLPTRKNPETVRRIFEGRKPVVSDLFYGAITKRPVISIDIPVICDGKVVYDLGMSFPADHLVSILLQQKLPPDWYGSILDSKNILIARSRNLERSMGKRVSPKTQQALKSAAEGTVEGTNFEGSPVFVSFSRSAMSGWTVLVGIPKASVMAGIYQWIELAVAGIAFISIFGVVLAMSYARRIARAIRSLVEPAVSIGRGDPVVDPGAHAVKETGEVAAALVQASELLQIRLRELNESEHRYASLFCNQIMGIAHCRVITGRHGQPIDYLIMKINRAYEQIIGVKKSEVEGRQVTEIVPGIETFAFDYIGVFGRIGLAGGETKVEIYYETTKQYLSMYVYSPLPGEFTVILYDITDRIQAENALKSSEERYRRLFEMESDTVLMLDWETGRIMDFNPAALSMYGYTDEEFVQLKHGDLAAEPSLTEAAVRNNETTIPLRWHRKKDGTLFPVEITRSYFEYHGSRVHVAAIRDITERAKAEEHLREMNQKLRDLSNHLQTLQERERSAIARDIHDDIGQNITVLKYDLEWIERRIPAGRSDMQERVDEMRASINQLTASVQRIAADLRPPLLDSMGLPAAIEWHVLEFCKRGGFEHDLLLDENIEPLDQHTETTVMRILQEGLTNVARHSRATSVSISLSKRGGDLILEISDNGSGITREQIASPKAYGMMGMQERARICRGELVITGNPGCGTTLQLTIPLNMGEPII